MINSEKPDIIKRLELNNTSDRHIKIRTRPRTKGGFTVLFDLCYKGRRNVKFMDKALTLIGTPSELARDREKIRIILDLRDKAESELLFKETGLVLDGNKSIDFILYFKKNLKRPGYKEVLRHLQIFTDNKKTTFKQIDYIFCLKFYNYLTAIIMPNSVFAYYSIFKAILNKAVKECIIDKSPAIDIKNKTIETKREFLNIDELRTLANTEFTNFDTCNAFLFSCFTGLRLSDIRGLTFDNIQDGYISFKQQKTSGFIRMKLNDSALNIFESQKKYARGEHIFMVDCLVAVNKRLRQWVKKAGINKYISFHCARHTFATLGLTNDIDIYTISKLLGHKDLKTTQIYAKLIDKKKDEAVDKLPNL